MQSESHRPLTVPGLSRKGEMLSKTLSKSLLQNFATFLPNITLPAKVHRVKATVFPVVMYGCESWTIEKAERQRRIDAFELWCWKRLLRVPWITKRSTSPF